MSNLLCMGLFLWFELIPSPRSAHVTNDRLATGLNVDVLDRHLLPALASVTIKSLQQGREATGQFVGLVQVLLAPLERLVRDHSPPITFHRRTVGRDELRRHHALEFVLRRDPDQADQRRNELFFRVRLWGRDEVLDALFDVYDRLPEAIRAQLPLRRTWMLVPDPEEASA